MATAPIALYLSLAQETAKPEGKTLLRYIADGGFLSYVLICLSVLAFALMVRSIIVLRRKLFVPEAGLREMTTLAASGDIVGLMASCGRGEHFAGRIMWGGLRKVQSSPLGMLDLRNGVEEEVDRETERLHRMNDSMAIIAAVAPMLGLLGTVIGMIGAFASISALQGAARSNELARFMSMALVNTAEGLVIAIPATVVFGLCRRRIESLVDDTMEAIEPIVAQLQRGGGGQPRQSGGGAVRPNTAPVPLRPAPSVPTT